MATVLSMCRGCGSTRWMGLSAFTRRRIKAARRRGALWVRAVDLLRLVPSAEGRARLWTRLVHGDAVHQTSRDTAEERYPELFDLAARLMPNATRILSFGCSTGEEIVSLRRRFPEAEIVGAEINRRSRRIASRRFVADSRLRVVAFPEGTFDIVFALAVLQREPFKIAEMEVEDLTPFYPFERFDAAVVELAKRLNASGLLCVDNAQYRVEDSSAADRLAPVVEATRMQGPLFGPDGGRLHDADGATMFRKL
jgi:SAM-dependent methyltransferase